MDTGCEIIEHTADVGIHVWAKTLKGLLIEAASGMVSLIVDIHTVCDHVKKEIYVEADTGEELLLKWLREILYLIEQTGMVFSTFQIKRDNFALCPVDKYVFYANLGGEGINPKRHDICTEIKAVTRHGLSLKKKGLRWEARILFDV